MTLTFRGSGLVLGGIPMAIWWITGGTLSCLVMFFNIVLVFSGGSSRASV